MEFLVCSFCIRFLTRSAILSCRTDEPSRTMHVRLYVRTLQRPMLHGNERYGSREPGTDVVSDVRHASDSFGQSHCSYHLCNLLPNLSTALYVCMYVCCTYNIHIVQRLDIVHRTFEQRFRIDVDNCIIATIPSLRLWFVITGLFVQQCTLD